MTGLLDHRGRPVRTAPLKRELAAPTVSGLRSIHTTHPASGLTPERLAALLREAESPGGAERYLELAEEMEERHLHYLGVLQTRRRSVAQIPVEVSPASEAAADVRVADEVRALFDRPAWEDEAFDLLDAVGKGFSVAEIVWETSERQWRPARLEHRLPQWFDFDQETGSRLVRRGGDGGWTELEPWKFVAHVASAKSGLPIRGGLARCAAWAWMAGQFTLRDWARYCEAYGMPMRVGRYHEGATREEIAVLKRAVRDLGADAAAVLPETMPIEFVTETPGSARADVFKEFVRHLDNQISVAVLGQTLTTEPGDSGSYSLGQVHDLVRRDIERADGRQLAATLRRDVAAPFVALNHGPDAETPRLSILRPDPADVEQLSRALERLVPLGLRADAAEVRRKLGLGAPAKDAETLAPPQQALAGSAALALLAGNAAGAAPDAVDLAVAGALADWRPLAAPAVRPLLDAADGALAAGGGMAAVRARLPKALAEMDDNALAGLLQRLAFSGRLSGRADGDGA